MARVTKAFDVVNIGNLITGVAAQNIRIYSIHMTNNATANDNVVNLVSLSPLTYYYGGADGSIYLRKDGGQFGLGSPDNTIPIFTINTGKSLYLDPLSAGNVSGVVIYEIS